jgi:hypothetical protein
MPRIESLLQYVDHVDERGRGTWSKSIPTRDLEASRRKVRQSAVLTDGMRTSWMKIKNPAYSHVESRREYAAGDR